MKDKNDPLQQQTRFGDFSTENHGGWAVERLVQVESIDGNIATVVADQMSACQGCAQKQTCGQVTLSGLRKPLRLQVVNILGAKVGDWVVISLPSSNLFRAMALTYGIPLTGFMVGGVVGAAWNDVVAISLAVLGFAGGFVISRKVVENFGPTSPTLLGFSSPPAAGDSN